MSNSTELTFDAQSLKEKISSQIKTSMFNLIPDEQFEQLVENEIKAFFNLDTHDVVLSREPGYDAGAKLVLKTSPFRQIVWNILHKEMQTKVRDFSESDAWKTGMVRAWNVNGETFEGVLSEVMQKRFEKMSIAMAQSMFQNMMLSSIEAMKAELANNPEFIRNL